MGAEPQRVELPDLAVGTHTLVLPTGIAMSDPLAPTVDRRLGEPAVGNGVTQMIATLYAGRAFGARVYDYRPGPVARDYGDPPSDDASAFREAERAITAFRIPGPANIARRTRLDGALMEVRGVGFADGDELICSRGIRRPLVGRTYLEHAAVISAASHQSNERMPVLVAGTIPVPRGIASVPNAMTLVGSVRSSAGRPVRRR